MFKYIASYTKTVLCSTVIEAETEGKAMELALELSEDYFDCVDGGYNDDSMQVELMEDEDV